MRRLEPILRSLLDEDILVAESDPREASPDGLPAAEAAQIERAVDKRRREFAAGRLLARELFAELGLEDGEPFLNGVDRAPIWPQGIVGTISHTRHRVAVAVARSEAVAGLGCDLEVDRPLSEELVGRVCLPAERRLIEQEPAERQGSLAMLVFSAKEAAYKAQYPLTGTVLAFSDLSLAIDPTQRTFKARFVRPVGSFAEGASLEGRWRRANGLLATAVTLRPDEVQASSPGQST